MDINSYIKEQKQVYRTFADPTFQKGFEGIVKQGLGADTRLEDKITVGNDDQESFDFIVAIFDSFGIEKKHTDSGIEVSMFNQLMFYVGEELKILSLSEDAIKNVIRDLSETYGTGNKTVLKLYLLFMQIGIPIYIYVVNGFACIKSEYEFDLIQTTQPRYQATSYQAILLNALVDILLQQEPTPNRFLSKYHLSEGEQVLMNEIRNADYQIDKVTTTIRNGKVNVVKSDGKEYDLSRFKEINDMIDFGSVSAVKHEGKKQHLKIEKTTKNKRNK